MKLSQEFNKTESRIQAALSKLDEFFLFHKFRVRSGTAPGTSQKKGKENQKCNKDRSQKDPHPEVGTSVNRSLHSMILDPYQVYHKLGA